MTDDNAPIRHCLASHPEDCKHRPSTTRVCDVRHGEQGTSLDAIARLSHGGVCFGLSLKFLRKLTEWRKKEKYDSPQEARVLLKKILNALKQDLERQGKASLQDLNRAETTILLTQQGQFLLKGYHMRTDTWEYANTWGSNQYTGVCGFSLFVPEETKLLKEPTKKVFKLRPAHHAVMVDTSVEGKVFIFDPNYGLYEAETWGAGARERVPVEEAFKKFVEQRYNFGARKTLAIETVLDALENGYVCVNDENPVATVRSAHYYGLVSADFASLFTSEVIATSVNNNESNITCRPTPDETKRIRTSSDWSNFSYGSDVSMGG